MAVSRLCDGLGVASRGVRVLQLALSSASHGTGRMLGHKTSQRDVRSLRGTFSHGWPYWGRMNDVLFERFVVAVETLVALHVSHDQRSLAREARETQAHDDSVRLAEQQMDQLKRIADNQAAHVRQCEESHKRTEDLARQRLQETAQ